jgi:hypothetical protein
MNDPASTQHQPHASQTGDEALSRALAARRAVLLAEVQQIDAKRAAGRITAATHHDQIHAAHAVYDRDCALAEVEAATGWQTWTGVGGVLYARRPNSSPPKVVRAPSAQALREAIERARSGGLAGANAEVQEEHGA